MKNILKIYLSTLLLASSLVPCGTFASVVKDDQAIETVSLKIQGLTICHQNEWRNLNINLEYVLADGEVEVNVQEVKAHIRAFLDAYSNMDDFWEIMNTKLVRSLSQAFPEMESIKSTLMLAPDAALHFSRKSIVVKEKGEDSLGEAFGFTKSNYLICQESFSALDLHVTWEMKMNPNPLSDYPDYQWIDQAIDAFFEANPVSFSKWKALKPQLQEHLLQQFPSLSSVEIEVTVAE